MAHVNEEQEIAERYSLNSLHNSGMHLLTFMSTMLTGSSAISYIKQNHTLTTAALACVIVALSLLASALSWTAYYVYRAESDHEFNEPSSQSKLFALNGLLGAAIGCTVVLIYL